MKIAYICNEYPPNPHGGIGTFIHTIANGLADRGHFVTVVGFGEDYRESEENGVRIVELPRSHIPKFAWLVDRIRLYYWLRSKANAGEIEIIETPDYQGWMPFRFSYCPVVARLQSSETVIALHTARNVSGVIRWCEARTLKVNKFWVGVSNYVYTETKKVFGVKPDEHKIIYYPVCPGDSSVQLAYDLPQKYILYAGTVAKSKGAYVLAKAARNILKDFTDIHLVYLGRTEAISTESEIREVIGTPENNRVHFPGQVSREAVPGVMKKASVFALPSYFESFGLVVAEAMLQGCPTICSDIGSSREFVKNNTTGILVPPDDHKCLAIAIKKILSDHDFAATLARNGKREISKRFSLERIIDQNIELYGSLIERFDVSKKTN